jgi:DNA-binding MarR family transcriptional regulator
MNYTDILIHIRKIVRALNLESKRIQKEYGISIPQMLCLIFLAGCKDSRSTHKAVADYLNLNKSTVTGIIGRLEKKGLVSKLPKEGDRRVSYVKLTQAGFNALENSPSLMHQQLSAKLQLLPDEELQNLDSSLRLLIHCLGIDQTEASAILTIEDPIMTDLHQK